MLSFVNDYSEGAHEKIMQRLLETNYEQTAGYGADPYTASAKKKILEACGSPEGEVYFLVGGTQTNQVVIDTMLKSYEGVIAAKTGHVSVHEAGAIEFTGHKVLNLNAESDKVDAGELKDYLEYFYADSDYEHMVFPGMVYISHPTEFGSLYTKKELEDIHRVCQSFDIPLYMDGARLAYGLASDQTDVTLKDIARLTDVFYIGGTKVGALFGEAVVFPHKDKMPSRFMTQIKQHGALMAKGRIAGIQFDTMFTDDLYLDMGRHALSMAKKLTEVLKGAGYEFYVNSPTNQLFLVLTPEQIKKLEGKVAYSDWANQPDGSKVVRFATSWATKEEDIQELKKYL